eukprot:342031_1
MGWRKGWAKKKRTNDGYQYGWDRTISYIDVAGFLKHYYLKKMRNEKLIILSGFHGTEYQYKHFKGLDLLVPDASLEEGKFYVEDQQTMQKLDINNLGIKKSLAWMIGYILSGVILLDMTKKLHRIIFFFLSQKSNVSVLHGQCYGQHNGFMENSVNAIQKCNNLINKELLTHFGIGAILGAAFSYIGIKLAQYQSDCKEKEKLSTTATLTTVGVSAVIGGIALAISPGIVTLPVAAATIAAVTMVSGYVVQKVKIWWKRLKFW